MTIDLVINSTAEEQQQQQQQQTSGDSSLIKASIQDDVEEKQAFNVIDGEAVGANEIRVANAVVTGWRLNLVLVW
jgi:hypothetical protein